MSSWFSPFIYNHKIVGGRWKIGSATAEMMRALSAHPDLTSELVSDAIPVCTWTIISNFGALLRLEEDLTCVDMPKRPESAKIVKEFMLLEGEHKVKPWKAGQPMRVERDADDSDDDFLKKELNLEALVMDEAIKVQLRSHWMDKSPTPWMDSWWRQIQIEISKKPHSKDIFRTATLLNYHTGYWGPTSAPSEARARKETTSVAIAEFCTILNYRVPLLCNTQSSAAHIRTLLELSLSFAINGETARQSKAGPLLTWPDGIVFDSKDASALSFDIVIENSRSLLNASLKRDQESIQKIINLVQSTPVAWPVVDEDKEDEETPTTSKSQAVRTNVATILENLVKVVLSLSNRYIYADLLYLQTLVDNAYEHRMKSLDVEMADADTDEDEDQNDKQKDRAKKNGGTEEDRLKFKFLHTVQGWNQDDKDDIGSVNNHATSISCLFSASETKNRLLTLGQIIADPSSQMPIVADSNKKQATSQDEVEDAPTTPIAIKNTIDDIAPHDKPRSRSVPSAPSPTPPVVAPVPQSTSRPSPVRRSNKGQGKAKRLDDPSSRQKRVPPPSINEDVISREFPSISFSLVFRSFLHLSSSTAGRRPSVKKRPRLNTAGERTGLSRLSSDDEDLHANADAADTDTEDDENAINLAISSLSQP
ncbi:hypothetical protein JVT61DRAFT_14982 [Boletus reticuloceps]|uniref:Uncharacterized protein n=1 Tax=Boletus reticuloceps TaxID=495285 RepID=A0A8I2YCF2_9AGAM|nr:hypothetical protein JVT61DRAFT_14982 [Boletus reticuloceps]